MSFQNLKTGFIGFGEVAYHLSRGLKEHGLQHIHAYVRHSNDRRYIQRAKEAGVVLTPSLETLVSESTLLFSAVHGNVASDIARQAAQHIKPGVIFADLNNATPAAKKLAAEAISARGATFVDVGLFEPPACAGLRALMFVSGEGAAQFKEIMSAFGLHIEVTPGEPYQATIIKTIANIYMKGLQAVCLETTLCARKAGVDLRLLGSLINRPVRDIPRENELAFWTIRGALSAARKTAELRDIITALKELGAAPVMMEAAARRLSLAADYDLKKYFNDSVQPDDYNAINDAFNNAAHDSAIDLR